MTNYTLNLTKNAPVPPATVGTITTDHPDEYAELGHDDTLTILLKPGSGWATGDKIERVDFYTTEQTGGCGASTEYWAPGEDHVPSAFTVTVSSDKQLTIKDAEQPAKDDPHWYKVTAGGLPLDPEVMNKLGSTTGRGWVRTSVS